MIEAILCDMDGTLIDTEFANSSAYSFAIAQYGVFISPREFQENYSGMSWKQFLPEILPGKDPEVYHSIANLKKKSYSQYFPLTKVYQPVLDFLLHSKNFTRIGLVTTASRQAVHDLLKYHQISELFDVIVSGDDVINNKPDAEPYLKAASELQVDISNCIALEDSQVGINSANSAKASVFIVKHEK